MRLNVLTDFSEVALFEYENVAQRAEELAKTVESYCEKGSDRNLKSAQEAYRAARRPWVKNRVFAFGPVIEQPLRLGPKIDFQPPRPDDIEEVLASEDELQEPSRTGAQLRGFPALEHMLFSEFTEEERSTERHCDYLDGIAVDFVSTTRRLSEAWSPKGDDYVRELTEPASSPGMFDGYHEALSGIVNRMGYVVENIRDQQLRDPMGANAESVHPELIVQRLSGRSIGDIEDALSALERLYFGPREEGDLGDSAGTTGALGLSAYAKSKGEDFDASFSEHLSNCRHDLLALGSDLEAAFVDDRSGVAQFDESLHGLQILIQVEIIGILGLAQIFNDVDGD